MHAALTRSSPLWAYMLYSPTCKYPEARQGLRALQQGCYHRYLSALQPAVGAWRLGIAAGLLAFMLPAGSEGEDKGIHLSSASASESSDDAPQLLPRARLGFCGRWRITSSAFKELAWLLQELLTVRDLQATLHGDNCAFPPAGVASCSVAALFFGKAKASLHYLCCLWKGPQHRATCPFSSLFLCEIKK